MTERLRSAALRLSGVPALVAASRIATAWAAAVAQVATPRDPDGRSPGACGVFCSPDANCTSGCPRGQGLFHCVGCGQDFHQCFTRSCSMGFCKQPTC